MTAVRLLGAVFIVLLVCHAAFLDLRDWFRARRACPVRRLAEDQWDYADDDYPDLDRRAEVAELEAMYALPAAVREDGAP